MRELASAGLMAGLWLSMACQSDPPASSEPAKTKTEPAEEEKPPRNSKIAEAMAQASSTRPSPASAALAPPASGIMALAEVERQAPRGKPATLTLGSTGAKPRLNLSPASWGPKARPTGKFTVAGRAAGGVLPNIDISVVAMRRELAALGVPSAPVDRLKGSVAAVAPTAITTVIELLSAVPSAQQPGRLPPGADKSIAALDGSVVKFTANAQGAVTAVDVSPKKDSPEVRPLLDEVAASLAAISLPYPHVPVGVGAYWMVTSRESMGGVESVAYRMLRITKVIGNVAEVNIKTRRYLASPKLEIEGLPSHTVRQFESEGSGSFTVAVGAAFPSKVELKESMLAMIAPDDRPQQVLPLQTNSDVTMEWMKVQ